MAEYIEKQAAIDEILGQPPEAHDPAWYAEQVKALPPADVRPVVRGVWRFEEQGPEDYEQFWRCPFCAEKTYFITNFCPNCGADMRGGDAE